MTAADVIIIGSGPAGVSAALPLVEAGRSVVMLDGADGRERTALTPAQRALGGALEGLAPDDGLSPKLRAPEARRALSRFAEVNRVCGENFVAVGSLARGGLSRLWGAFAAEFSAADLAGWPISLADLAPSYARISARIGISGAGDDATGRLLGASGPLQPPLALGAASALLLDRYRRRPVAGLALGHARNAVLSERLAERPACDLRNDCLWGCPLGAIYDSRQDLTRLSRLGNFRLADGAVVVALEKAADTWDVRCADGRIFSAPRVVLAAGTLGSTRLAAPLLAPIADWPLLSNPVVAAPMLVPARMPAQAGRGHSLAQLAFLITLGTAEICGAIYETVGLPVSGFVNQLPLGRRAGEAVFRFLSPMLLVVATSFPGSFSRNRLRFDPAGNRLTVQGGFSEGLDGAAREVRSRLAGSWRRLGALILPGGRLATPGTDAHFAGTLPMGGAGANGTNVLGELTGHAGLHIVDGSVLPGLPARHATLTIMANADRIARSLAGL